MCVIMPALELDIQHQKGPFRVISVRLSLSTTFPLYTRQQKGVGPALFACSHLAGLYNRVHDRLESKHAQRVMDRSADRCPRHPAKVVQRVRIVGHPARSSGATEGPLKDRLADC
jgi:hypothetical protein